MKTERITALQDLRQMLDGGADGWPLAILIVIGVIVVAATIGSSLVLPIALARLNTRLAEVERRLDTLSARLAAMPGEARPS